MAKEKIETLDVQRKKKKNIFYIIGIVLLLGIIFISFLIEFLNTQNVYKERGNKKDLENRLKKETTIGLNKNTFKEDWAISVENKMEKQDKELKSNLKDINKTIIAQTNILEKNNEKINNLKEISKKNILKTQEALTQSEKNTKNWIKAIQRQNKRNLEKKIRYLNNKIRNLKKEKINNYKKGKISNSKKEKISNSELPKKPNDIKHNKIDVSLKDRINKIPPVVIKNLDTSKQRALIKQKEEEVLKLENAKNDFIKNKINKEKLPTSFHIMTGFAEAYMITGAYAPVFSAGQSQPLPVLMQIEGDILIANDDRMSIDKCFLIGSATGNMNSQTADIRLVKLSCSLFGGTKKVEGSISGWAISETGVPGIPGVLVHKNGALLAKTFVAGFMQQLSGFLSNVGSYVGTPVANRNVNQDPNIGADFQSAVAGGLGAGLQTVFGKLSDYYLKMAEQIFPVVEVKGGRTISILLSGGEDFTISDLNKLSLESIEEESDNKEKRINEILFSDDLLDLDFLKLKESGKNIINNNSENKGGKK